MDAHDRRGGGIGATGCAEAPRVTEAPGLWRVPQPVRALALAVFFLFVAVAALATAFGIAAWGAILVWVLVLLVTLLVWRWYLVPYVELTTDRLVVQGAVALRSVRYDAIRHTSPGVLGLRIHTSDGAITAWAIQKSRISEWLHRETPADDLAAQIMRRVAHAA